MIATLGGAGWSQVPESTESAENRPAEPTMQEVDVGENSAVDGATVEGVVEEGPSAKIDPALADGEPVLAEGAITQKETPSFATRGVELGPFTISGNFNQRYRYRTTAGGSDQDLYGYLNLDAVYVGDGETTGRWLREARLHLDMSYNFDANTATEDPSGFFPFFDVTNTFGGRTLGFLHSAYVQVDPRELVDTVRLGRQHLQREAGLIFDGLFVRTKRMKDVWFDLYGGLPTHLYESSSTGDALAGAGINYEPLRGLLVGADYFYLRDRRKDFVDSEDQFGILRGRYRASQEWMFRGSASWNGSRDRRQLLEARYLSQDLGLLAQMRLIRQNAVVEFQSSEISPYIIVQGTYSPYYQAQLDLHQPFAEHYGVGGGVNVRQLQDESDEGLFNHSFRNYFLSLDARDLWAGMRASIRGNAWDAGSDDMYSFGFELEQKMFEILRLRVGSSYALYRFDLVTGEERNRDRVYYVRARWHVLPRMDIDTNYQYERDSITEYHTVMGGFRIWF